MAELPLRVLVLEDSKFSFEILAGELRSGFPAVEIERVDEPAALGAALSERWDVVLSDWEMPRLSALEALHMLDDLGLEVPFIIVAGTIVKATEDQAMEAGARACLLKSELAKVVPTVKLELERPRASAGILQPAGKPS